MTDEVLTQNKKLNIFFYRPRIDISIEAKFCYLVAPLLFGTKIEKNYRVQSSPQEIRFDGSLDWRNDHRWKDYQFDPNLINIVESPEDADFFIFPYLLEEFIETWGIFETNQFINSLPYFKNNESKHVFMTYHDNNMPFYNNAVFFRTSINKFMKDINAFAIPYAVEDFAEFVHIDSSQIKYHTCFAGFVGSSEIRVPLVESIKKKSHLSSYLNPIDRFYGFLDADIMSETREIFIDSMAHSWTALCPKGKGENTYRFFEAMSMGRIPILISDNCLLPYEDEIDYASFMLRLSENDISNAGSIILDWVSGQTAETLIAKCNKSRHIWENYFKCSAWNKPITKILLTIQQRKDLELLDQKVRDLLTNKNEGNAIKFLHNYINRNAANYETNYEFHHEIALLFWESKDYNNSVKYFETALRISHYNRSVVFNYFDMLFEYQEFAKAKALIDTYLSMNPADSEMLSLLQDVQG
jgi:hypothetical protein